MKIALLAPIETSSVMELLGNPSGTLPRGYPGAPLFGILATALVERGHQVHAFTTDSSLYGNGNRTTVINGPYFSLHCVPSRPHSFRPQGRRPGRMLDFFAYERKGLLEALNGFKPDVIHAHWTYEFAWAALDSEYPHVITAHDSPWDVLLHMKDLYRAGRYLMARNVLRRAKHLTAVSPVIKDRITHFSNTKVNVVPNPIPDEFFHMRQRAELPTDTSNTKIIMIINGWSAIKNPQPALSAFAKARITRPGWELHCYGADFGHGERAYKWLEQHGSLAGVHLHGKKPYSEVISGLSIADAMIHPSRTEACSMAIAEAMSLGVPVIGGKSSGGVPWQLEFGAAGYLTDVESPESILATLLSCIDGVPERAAIRTRAIKRAEALFSSAHIASLYETEYRNALCAQTSATQIVPA